MCTCLLGEKVPPTFIAQFRVRYFCNEADFKGRKLFLYCIYLIFFVQFSGNGPSGITLSYLLNGYRPYYNKIPHPDPMLSARLIECTQKSLLHQDLSFLSQVSE